MFRKLLDGLVFGTGFGIALVTVWIVAMYFVIPMIFESKFEASGGGRINEDVVSVVPSLSESGRFLDSPGVYSGGFLDNKNGVLSGGDGVITGSALVNEKPLKGLRLRLALNGSVYSQWATTDEHGTYRVSVPDGEYQIDGYELDYAVANRLLSGKINHPENRYSSGRFQVATNQEGHGLRFRFVDPVVKSLVKSRYSPAEAVILKWEAYPGASEYTVQVYEKPDADSWKSTQLFEWQDRPRLFETELDLSQYDIKLRPGYFYTFEVQAASDKGSLLSNTYREHDGYDFEVTNN